MFIATGPHVRLSHSTYSHAHVITWQVDGLAAAPCMSQALGLMAGGRLPTEGFLELSGLATSWMQECAPGGEQVGSAWVVIRRRWVEKHALQGWQVGLQGPVRASSPLLLLRPAIFLVLAARTAAAAGSSSA